MFHLRPFRSQVSFQFAVALVAVGSWLSGCGDDDGPSSGRGGSGGTAGSAGSATGGTAGSATGGSSGAATGGSGGAATGGSPSGGSAGAATGGSGGSTAGSAGLGGEGGDDGMAGEGGEGAVGGAGEGGMGQGGEGGTPEAMCIGANLSVMLVSAAPMQAHDHLPIAGADLTRLVNMINSGTPLIYTLPEEGTNPHVHTLTFTAPQLTLLRNGGALAMNVTTSSGGPANNMHTHTYSIECQP